MKVYLASPWFTDDQDERERRIKSKLREIGLDVFSPRDESLLSNDSSIEDQQKTFEIDLKAILSCDAVFAITNGKDMGTLFECGYAFANDVPLIYFAEGLNGQFNLMLARSAVAVFTDIDDITMPRIHHIISTGSKEEYKGEIE